MSFRDVLAIVTSQISDDDVIGFAEQFAERDGGIMSTLVVGWMPSVAPVVEGWVVDPSWGEVVNAARRELHLERAKVAERVAQKNARAPVESAFLQIGAARQAIGMRARHADVSIVRRALSDAGDAIVEGALFESGRPVIVVPPGWKSTPVGKSIVVCWKPTREAARALADAGEFLAHASRVSVATVDAKPTDSGYGEHPGADITSHLARKKIKTELINLDSMGRSQAKAIQDHALAVSADLIVMGGYGRSRLSEFVFGGMTREMLQTANIPILLSH